MRVQCTATPGEVRDWQGDLVSLPSERAEAVIRMLSEVIGTCAPCEGPVRRCDQRRLVEGQLVHLACAPPEPRPVVIVQRPPSELPGDLQLTTEGDPP